MKTVYRICGKIALLCYLILLYQTWHLCRYGGVRHHFMILLPVGQRNTGEPVRQGRKTASLH